MSIQDSEDFQQLIGIIKEILLEAKRLAKECDPIGAQQLCKIANKIAKERRLGLDFWTPPEASALNIEAFEELSELIHICEQKMAPPLQALLELIALIPKPKGGGSADLPRILLLCGMECGEDPRR